MAIHFSKDRLEQALDAHTRWWNGTLDRPLASVVIPDAYAAEKRTSAPVLSQQSCDRFEWTPEQVIDAMDEMLGWQEYLGDSFPLVNFDAFGPGILAALCDGARLDNSSGRVWFFPFEEKELCDIHVKYDPENRWARRIRSLYRAGVQRWEGSVVMTMPDLGGVMDVMAAIRGSENLLLDLYDCPEEVQRLKLEIETAWREAYEDFRRAMGSCMLYTDWSQLLSKEPSYVIQCDFCYMISNPMFREFVLDTLVRDSEYLTNMIYHLDGIGALRHLDDVCSIKKLNAVQWVYGDGQPGPMHWLDVYRKILDAGKQIMIVAAPEDYIETVSVLHGAPYSVHWIAADKRGLAEAVVRAR